MLRLVETPDVTTLDEMPGRWALEWRPQERPAGAVDLVLRTQGLRMIISWRWVEFEPPEGAETVWRIEERVRFNNVQPVLARFHLERWPQGRDALRLAVIAATPLTPGVDASLWLDAVRGEDVLQTAGPVVLRALPGPAETIEVASRPAPEADGSLRVCLTPTDCMGYPSPLDEPRAVALRQGGRALWSGELTDGVVVSVRPASPNGTVRLALDGMPSRGCGPVWMGHREGMMPLLGAIHWHTMLSGDGARTPAEAFEAARDFLNLDFAAPGDHNPAGDKWTETVHACDRFNEPGRFATFYGFERSSSEGHVNFYFLDPGHPMNPDRAPRGKPADYIDDLPEDGSFLVIPHHTNAKSSELRKDGTHYWLPYPWGRPQDCLRLVEIFQARGNFEREDPPEGWRTCHRNNGASVQTALDRGHRLGFVGGTDNHCAWPAMPNPRALARNDSGAACPSCIYTGVWATGRSGREVFDALWARRSWACWDTRAIVWMTVGGVLQGGELDVARGTPLDARIVLSAEAPLDVLEVVTNGGRVAWRAPVPDGRLDLELEAGLGVAEHDAYYYLRARQIDGALIYGSPVFVRVVTAPAIPSQP